MSNVRMRTFIVSAIGFLAIVLTAFWPIITSAAHAHVGVIHRLETDNITTTGNVVSVGHSTIGNGPFAITYAYDVPGFPRNGNPGSFEREQVITPNEMSHYHAGMPVKVEYSRVLKGASRLEGYGSGIIFLHEMFQTLKTMLLIGIPFSVLGHFLPKLLKWRKLTLVR